MYSADFETTTDEKDCRVWAWGLCEIGNPSNFQYGNNFDTLFELCKNSEKNLKLFFHNLKFDGEFWFYQLLTNGYQCIKDKKDRKDKTFTCLISDTGQFYSIEVYFEVKKKQVKKVTIYDSLKILNFSVEKIAKDFNLPIRKGNLDYKGYRCIGHKLNEEEVAYLRNDVEIMSRALDIMFKQDLTKMTIGSDALSTYKKLVPSFDTYFPVLDYLQDEGIRNSYKGGWTYLNPIYAEKHIKEGIVLDKNSMYPSHMYNDLLPIGKPLEFKGQYKENRLYPLYIQIISCSFKLKKNKLPSIQLKNNPFYIPNQYIETTNGDIVTLCLTDVDLKLFFEQYEVDDLIYQGGYMFKGLKGLFCSYIDKWMSEKNKAKKENNGALYTISKLMLNSLYGKFGLNPNVRGKYPTLTDEGIIKYKLYEREIRDSIYCPLASWVTAYSRNDIIRSSQAIRDYSLNKYGKDYYIYSDTDSIHMLKMNEEELKSFLDIDDYKLGAWKMESEFKEALFIRQKCYIEKGYDNKLNTTIAGLPKKCGQYITMKNFKKGFTIKADDENYTEKKLRYKHVKGGVILVETDFTIK